MRRLTPCGKPARATWLACCLAVLPAAGRAAPPADPHAVAVAALGDVETAIDAVVGAEDSYSTDPAFFKAAAGRAIEALKVAVGRIESLLGDAGEQPWVNPMRGAEVNLLAASARLRSAKAARELSDFQVLASQALISMKAAQGRATELGVFGGMEGALATTVLGIPKGGQEVDGCAPPRAAPAWGTHSGYVAWVTVPQADGMYRLEQSQGGTDVTVQGGLIVLHTPAAATVARLCAAATTPSPHASMPAPSSSTPAATPTPSATAPQSRPALFTEAQAKAGEPIYARACAACHGANLHGVSAPSVAGTDFLKTAQGNDWSSGGDPLSGGHPDAEERRRLALPGAIRRCHGLSPGVQLLPRRRHTVPGARPAIVRPGKVTASAA